MSDSTPRVDKSPLRKDPAWQYCLEVPNKPTATQCKFCHKILQGGGITRMKNHLGNGTNVDHCTKQGKQVREMFQKMLRDHKKQKSNKQAAKKRYEDNMAEIISDSEEGEEEELDSMGFRQSDTQRAKEISADFSEAEQLRSFHGSHLSGRGSGSGSARFSGSANDRSTKGKGKGKLPTLLRSFSTKVPRRVPDIEEVDADAYSRGDRSQKTLKESFSKSAKGAGDKFRHLWTKMAVWGGINANQLSNNPFTQPAIDAAIAAGKGVEVPSAHTMYGPALNAVVGDVDDYIEKQRKKWEQYGVTIMCDGWTGPTKKSLINFLVYCDGNCCFIGSADVTEDLKDYKCIMKQLKKAVDWVGPECVVQVVTDNGPNYKKAGERLSKMQGYNFLWTGCAAHSLDLILKDFSKRESVKKIILKAKEITKYLYNHSRQCALMRVHCGGDIVRPVITRFATYFLAMQSMLAKKRGLEMMIKSAEWKDIKKNIGTNKMARLEDIINDTAFWRSMKIIVECLEPIVRTLRLVDADERPNMGFLYRWMQMCREQVEQTHRYPKWVLDLIDNRWEKMLSHTLHKAAFYLNPCVQYGPDSINVGIAPDLVSAVNKAIAKLIPDVDHQVQCVNELKIFKDRSGSFSSAQAKVAYTRMLPAEWWMNYGTDAPRLRQLAVKILSQTVASSGCERNWSTFGMIHSARRNRLSREKLDRLVYCHYNLRLMSKHVKENILKKSIPIDLSTLYPASDGDEAPFDWIAPLEDDAELDDNNLPNAEIANIMEVNPQEHALPERRPEDEFSVSDDPDDLAGDGEDLFITDTDDDDDDDDTDDDDDDDDGDDDVPNASIDLNDSDEKTESDDGREGANVYEISSRGVLPQGDDEHIGLRFTGETDFQYATQDENHGARTSRGSACGSARRSRQRRPLPDASTASSIPVFDEQSSGSRQDGTLLGLFGNCPSDGYYSNQGHGYSSAYSNEAIFPNQQQGYGNTASGSSSSYAGRHVRSNINEYTGYPICGYLLRCTEQEDYERQVQYFRTYFSAYVSWEHYCVTYLLAQAELESQGHNVFEAGRHSYWG